LQQRTATFTHGLLQTRHEVQDLVNTLSDPTSSTKRHAVPARRPYPHCNLVKMPLLQSSIFDHLFEAIDCAMADTFTQEADEDRRTDLVRHESLREPLNKDYTGHRDRRATSAQSIPPGTVSSEIISAVIDRLSVDLPSSSPGPSLALTSTPLEPSLAVRASLGSPCRATDPAGSSPRQSLHTDHATAGIALDNKLPLSAPCAPRQSSSSSSTSSTPSMSWASSSTSSSPSSDTSTHAHHDDQAVRGRVLGAVDSYDPTRRTGYTEDDIVPLYPPDAPVIDIARQDSDTSPFASPRREPASSSAWPGEMHQPRRLMVNILRKRLPNQSVSLGKSWTRCAS